MITIRNIAAELNISTATVSRAMNNKGGVGKALRSKIQRVAKEIGYHPNWKAKGLVEGKIGVIGVIISRDSEAIFSNPFYPEVLKGIGNVANQLNIHMLLSIAEKYSYASLYLKRLVDGLIVVAHRISDEKIAELEEKKIPTVLIPGYLNGADSTFPSVNVDNRESVFQATDHLIRLGHRKISFILGNLDSKFTLERLEGYKEAFQIHKIPLISEYLMESDFSKKLGYQLMVNLLALPSPPTAVIGINDNVTIGAIQAINNRNLQIPKDISVITIGDTEYVSDFVPPLTAIKLPLVEIGKKATQTLFNLMNGVHIRKRHIILPADFIIRGSTGVPSQGGRPHGTPFDTLGA